MLVQDFEIVDQSGVFSSLCCEICSSFMLRPLVMPCGHTFCDVCTKKLVEGAAGRKCAVCRAEIGRGQLPVNVHLLSVGSTIPAKCLLCPWEGIVEQISSHKGVCENKMVQCDSKGCTTSTTRKDMPMHKGTCPFRSVPCPLCSSLVPLHEKRVHERERCPQRLVVCPYYYGAEDGHTIKMQELPQHLKTCEEKVWACPVPRCPYFGHESKRNAHFMSHADNHQQLWEHQFNSLVELVGKAKTTTEVWKNMNESVNEDVCYCWTLSGCKSEIDRANTANVPLTSEEWAGATTRWRFAAYPWAEVLSVQLVSSYQPFRGRISVKYDGTNWTPEEDVTMQEGGAFRINGVPILEGMKVFVRIKRIQLYL